MTPPASGRVVARSGSAWTSGVPNREGREPNAGRCPKTYRPSVDELAAKVGVHPRILPRWLRAATTVRAVDAKDDNDRQPPRDTGRVARRPQDWPAEEKVRAIRAATGLSGSELGALLRREGLHDADLTNGASRSTRRRWRRCLTSASAALTRSGSVRWRATSSARKRAVAEAAALLVLSKNRVRSAGTRAATRRGASTNHARCVRGCRLLRSASRPGLQARGGVVAHAATLARTWPRSRARSATRTAQRAAARSVLLPASISTWSSAVSHMQRVP